MAGNREILLKLIIDDKEAVATLQFDQQQVDNLRNKASGLTDTYVAAFKKITNQVFQYNEVSEEAVNATAQWLASQNLTQDEILQTIATLQQLNENVNMNSSEWTRNATALANLTAAHDQLLEQKTAMIPAQRGMVQGSQNMTMAMSQLGFAVGDASMITLNFRMALMGVSNNIPFIVQYFVQAAREAKNMGETFGSLVMKSLRGGGGLILGINALMLLLNVLPGLFSSATKEMEKQKDEIKDLAKEYENLSVIMMKHQMQTLEARKKVLELEQQKLQRTETTTELDISEGSGIVTSNEVTRTIITDQESFDRNKEELEEINKKLTAIERTATLAEGKVRRILSGNYDLTSINKVKDAIDALNKEFADAGSDEERSKFQERIDQLEEIKQKMEGGSGIYGILNLLNEEIERMEENLNKASSVELAKQINDELKELKNKRFRIEVEIGIITPPEKPEEILPDFLDEDVVLPDAQYAFYDELEKMRIDTIDNEFERQRALVDYEYEMGLERYKNYENFEEVKLNLYAAKRKAEAEIDRMEAEHQLETYSMMFGQLAGMFGEHTAAYKVFAIGQTIVDTYRAAAAALTPPPVGAGPLLGPALAATTIISGLARVAKIQQTDMSYTGMATGGIMIAEAGEPEVIAPAKEYAKGWAEVAWLTSIAIDKKLENMKLSLGMNGFAADTESLRKELVQLRNEFVMYAEKSRLIGDDEINKIGTKYKRINNNIVM